ncbi:spore germination protein [Rossellomorea aquimaris]|uniref:Spore gernimation protein KA n=1 Tax=Rossellomorea aquimaris TaxID=189382 RepID=A0A1J6X0L6_9BACI|nr:spore germination protein [Rossellomorea aquimaris]OIU71689.1 spore gernimation protein KA [Rossellomorea aquimaris]
MSPIKIIPKNKKKKSPKYKREEPIAVDDPLSHNNHDALKSNLDENIAYLKSVLGDSGDLIFRKIHPHPEITMVIVYIDGLSGAQQIQDSVIKSVMEWTEKYIQEDHSLNFITTLGDSIMTIGNVEYCDHFGDIFSAILSGDSVILVNGYNQAVVAKTKDPNKRDVSEPQTQSVVRGPQEGFTEDIRTNTSLVRRKIKSVDLRLESRVVGRYTHTDVSIMYIKGIANEDIVEEVRRRIDKIDIDAILESAYIEELIQDSTISPFPTMFNSERPDVVAGGLLEGRIAILVDGTPFVLLVPVVFPQFFQSAEDYYQRSDFGIIRLLRYVAFFFALLSPSLFIAIKTYHQELIPTALMITLAAQREGVPFPAFVEALIMEVTFEILREAGIRMPKAVGQAISIVGALVIGQAAVEAGFVTPAMVIVVAVTAISTFVFPAYNLAIAVRGLRFAFMILAATFGLFGVTIGLFMMVIHLCSLRSFGIPYMFPIAPYNKPDQKDSIFHFPLKWLSNRPRLINQTNLTKQAAKKSTDN